jgi:hypothetical protein
MPDAPLPTQTDVTIQNQATGAIDFLKYEGSTLVASQIFNYGIGSDWKVVASEQIGSRPGLVVQSQSTGFLDFLGLDANGNLVSSDMSNVPVPHVAGFSDDYGPSLVSQLPDGELDFLQVNTASGVLSNSDLVPNTAGLPRAVGVAAFATTPPEFQGLTGPDSVVTQLADGSVDLLGFTGNVGTLAFSSSELLAGSAGTPTIGAVNQNNNENFNVLDFTNGTEGLQLIGTTGGGQADVMYYDTGKNDTTNTGRLYATNLLNTAFSGWNVVDGGDVNHTSIFPVS